MTDNSVKSSKNTVDIVCIHDSVVSLDSSVNKSLPISNKAKVDDEKHILLTSIENSIATNKIVR